MNYINLSCGMQQTPLPEGSTWEHRRGENNILFLGLYYLLKRELGELDDLDLITFDSVVEVLQAYNTKGEIMPGLYDRGAYESKLGHEWYHIPEERRKISHDNITAIARLSDTMGKKYALDIAKHAIKYHFRFDNIHPDDPKWKYISLERGGKTETSFQFHPRDWFFWLFCAGGIYRLVSWLFFPIFFLANIITCLNNGTSGKQLMIVRLIGQSNLLLKSNYFICDKLLKRKYKSVNWVYVVLNKYHGGRAPNHPIIELAKRLN